MTMKWDSSDMLVVVVLISNLRRCSLWEPKKIVTGSGCEGAVGVAAVAAPE